MPKRGQARLKTSQGLIVNIKRAEMIVKYLDDNGFLEGYKA